MPDDLISIIMPAYKVEKYVGEAIRSVLAQSYRHFELIVVDDGSPDDSIGVIRSFADPRIRAIRLDTNRGVAAARNLAIAEARGDFLALMDADDLMNPLRLEKQLAFMRRRPGIALSGGWCRPFQDERPPGRSVAKVLLHPSAVNASLVFGNVFCTSSVMMRREAVPPNGFRQRYAEDYDFLVSVAARHRLGIMNEVLVDYRVRPDSAMRTYDQEVKNRDVWESQAPLFESLGIVPSPREREIHLLARNHAGNLDGRQLSALCRWYGRLIEANRQARAYPDDAFKRAASFMWFEQLFRATGCGGVALRMFLGQPLSFAHRQPWFMTAKFVAKALIGRPLVRNEPPPARPAA